MSGNHLPLDKKPAVGMNLMDMVGGVCFYHKFPL